MFAAVTSRVASCGQGGAAVGLGIFRGGDDEQGPQRVRLLLLLCPPRLIISNSIGGGGLGPRWHTWQGRWGILGVPSTAANGGAGV